MKDIRRTTVLAVALLAVAIPCAADPVLCQKKSGAVFVRTDACKRRESAVSPAQLGVAGLPGAKGNTGAAGAPGPAAFPFVVSADGKVIGEWIDFDQVATSSPLDGVLLVASANRLQGLAGEPQQQLTLFYAAPNCQGPPLIGLEDPTRRAYFRGGQFYYPADPLADHAVASFAQSFATCQPGTETAIPGVCCRGATSRTIRAGAAVDFDPAALGAPPFHTRETP